MKYVPAAARQKQTKANMASTAHWRLSSTPAAAGAANTSTFLDHCLGRASFTRPTGSGSRLGAASGGGTGASGGAAGLEAVVLMAAPGSHPGRELAPHGAGQVTESGHE